ncbi:hypothetical protein [Parageobacillus thermoglucosidasius]|uniref:Uncharacterized protein n=1 Tax=Parageobacillus thermoglucosidasius TaxID=1426 RepID=A0A1B7KPH2_PARTM|nr:hypothetical protein [Parageobacillus thermoglucosidasius]OAT71910.1 hypothetical protein A7K69_10905 [Parageobacillus thermoglucosidasius]
MTDFPDGSVLRETISGKWYRIAKGCGRSTLLLDLPNGILLAINVSSKMIEILVPDKNEIYRRAGDVSFEIENGKTIVHLFSEALEEIQLDTQGTKISNTFSELTSIFAKLDLSKVEEWYTKRIPD